MKSLHELYEEYHTLSAQYREFPREWFRKPGETEPPFSPYRSPELLEHDAKVGAVAEQIQNHPDCQNFEATLAELVKDKIHDDTFAHKVYHSLCNITWVHEKGDQYSCTWRYAGGLVAEMRNKGEDYMHFYCGGNEGTVATEIEELLETRGWTGEDT